MTKQFDLFNDGNLLVDEPQVIGPYATPQIDSIIDIETVNQMDLFGDGNLLVDEPHKYGPPYATPQIDSIIE